MLATMTIGQTITVLRSDKGLSQRALAKRVGVAISTVAHWELDTKTPSVLNRARLADVFGISVTSLMPDFDDLPLGPIVVSDRDTKALVTIFQKMPPQARESLLSAARVLALVLGPAPL